MYYISMEHHPLNFYTFIFEACLIKLVMEVSLVFGGPLSLFFASIFCRIHAILKRVCHSVSFQVF